MTTYNSTIRSRARIQPPTDYRVATLATMRTIVPKVEIQWDGISWTDESAYILSIRGDAELSGDLGEASSAQIDVELDNTTDRFTPTNSLGALYGYFEPRVAIRIGIDFNDTDYYVKLFTGYIKSYQPKFSSRICNLHCFDNLKFILNQDSPYGDVYTDYRIDELIKVLLDYAGLTNYDLDESTQTVNGAWFNGEKLIHTLINELTIAERGRSFFDAYGTFKFWNKNRLHDMQPVITLTKSDNILDIDYQVAEHVMKNKITVEATPRGAMGLQQVWSNIDPEIADIYSDSLVFITAGEQQSAWIELEDPATGWVEPIADTDYTANAAADGSGTDLTSSIEITTFNTYAKSAFITVRNNSATDAYLTKFSIRANPVKIYKYIRVIAKDETSMQNYGVKDVLYQNMYIDSETQANAIAYEELERWKSSLNTYNVVIRGVPYLYVGDIVKLEVEDSTYAEFMISRMSWSVNNNGQYEQSLTLVDPIAMMTLQTITAKACIA